MKTFLTTTLLILIGATLGYFMVLLLPVLFVTWLQSYIVETREPHQVPIAGWMSKTLDGKYTWTWWRPPT